MQKISIILVSMLFIFVSVTTFAGNLDSPAPPTDVASAMYSLTDIYNRLLNGEPGSKRVGPFREPTSGPSSTGYTLDEIMAVAPEADNVNGATPELVLIGKTFWGLRSDGSGWGLQMGTAPAGSNVTGTKGELTFPISDGMYTDGKTATAQDADLLPENIKSGVNIFGVVGNVLAVSSYPAPVPKTGWVISFGDGWADDGELQMGVAWPIPRFTDNGDGTVTDNLTGLIWLKKASCGGKTYLGTALTFSNSLHDGWIGDGTGGDCGLSDGSVAGDWRLPNRNELLSLISVAVSGPAVPNTEGTGHWSEGDPFTMVQSDDYLSSTGHVIDIEYSWVVDFSYGRVNGVRDASGYSWPVRGGQ